MIEELQGDIMKFIPVKSTLISIVITLLITSFGFAQRQEPQKIMIKNHTMYKVLKPGDIPAIFEPEFLSVSEADDYYYPDEPLIAVIDSNIARGYSTWHLDHHEVVNDFINGRAIAVTW